MYRKIDNLGRIVIPKEIRKKLRIKENDLLNISASDNKIIITKELITKDAILEEIATLKKKLLDIEKGGKT